MFTEKLVIRINDVCERSESAADVMCEMSFVQMEVLQWLNSFASWEAPELKYGLLDLETAVCECQLKLLVQHASAPHAMLEEAREACRVCAACITELYVDKINANVDRLLKCKHE